MNMDEDTVFGIVLCFLFILIITLPLSLTACIAAHATRKWSRERARRAQPGTEEAEQLVDESDSEMEDEDFLDSEDEDYYNSKKEQKHREREEQARDWQLSGRAKFLKEWKKCWSGPVGGKDQSAREKELKDQEERRKIAREAVREYLRLERRKARKAQRSSKKGEDADETMELPSYGNAVGQSKE